MKIPQLSKEWRERFWDRVRRQDENACWPWPGARAGKGYGYLGKDGCNYYTHIIAFYLHIGVWPVNCVIMHTCDNPACCNPNHLIEGTHTDNNFDSVIKKRRTKFGPGCRPGILHHATSLKPEDIIEIRKLGILFGPTAISRMPQFKNKITPSGVGCILRGETWSHVQ